MQKSTTSGAFLLFVLAACDRPTPPPVDSLDAATVQQLFERMDRLTAALESLPRAREAAASRPAAAADRVLVASNDDELLARIEALEGALSTLRARGANLLAPPPRTAAAPPTRQVAVDHAVGQLKSEDAGVAVEFRRSLFRLTEDQVLAQFGMPTGTSIADGVMQWWYNTPKGTFRIYFLNGRVARIRN